MSLEIVGPGPQADLRQILHLAENIFLMAGQGLPALAAIRRLRPSPAPYGRAAE
jgi:hypothetical protein